MKPLPKSMSEALAQGFKVIGHVGYSSVDELNSRGTMDLEREDEVLEVPYEAKYTFGVPKPKEWCA